MLKRLTIDNFALINHIDVAFDDGLSIITGETGAGKSIIIGALSLLLGSRADSKSVKDRNEKMVVEAVFDIGDYDLGRFSKTWIGLFPRRNDCAKGTSAIGQKPGVHQRYACSIGNIV